MKSIFLILPILIFTSCRQKTEKINDKNKVTSTKYSGSDIKPFKLTVLNSNYSLGYATKYVLTEQNLQITCKRESKNENDSTLFTVELVPSYALQKVSTINTNSLQEYYANPCIKDGSQLTVIFEKDHKSKTIQLSNFYQADIGQAIEFINSLTSEEYKIWYDKARLLKAQEDCR